MVVGARNARTTPFTGDNLRSCLHADEPKDPWTGRGSVNPHCLGAQLRTVGWAKIIFRRKLVAPPGQWSFRLFFSGLTQPTSPINFALRVFRRLGVPRGRYNTESNKKWLFVENKHVSVGNGVSVETWNFSMQIETFPKLLRGIKCTYFRDFFFFASNLGTSSDLRI